jgi:diguanylate cyclase (GGDEF)-like protein/PAS domain S-box-containing protein
MSCHLPSEYGEWEEMAERIDHPDYLGPLEAELALHRDALEHMHHGLCMFDPDGTIVLCNRRYAEILRLPPESIRPGLTGSDIIQLGIDAGHYPPGKKVEQIREEIREQFRLGPRGPGLMVRDGRTYAVKGCTTPRGYTVATCEDITAQIEAQRALQASEARLRAIVDAMPDSVKIFDADARLVHINPKGLELLEAPDFDTLTTCGHVHLPPEHLAKAAEVHQRVIAGESLAWEYEVVGLKGRRRRVEANAVPFRMPDGSIAHMCITRDVSERKAANDALRRSEERLRLVQEATGLADFEAGADGLMLASERFFQQLGLPVADGPVDAKAWAAQVHPDDLPALVDGIEDAMAGQEDGFRGEFRIIRADNGETRWLACSARLQYDTNGAAIRTIGAHLDITERKRAEEALRRSERRLRLVQEATGLADFETDADGITSSSSRFFEQIGIPPREGPIKFSDWLEHVHPDDRERLLRKVLPSKRQEDTIEHEFRVVRADTGEVRWLVTRTTVECTDPCEPVRYIGAHLDITGRKSAEEALRESEERFRLAAEAAGLGVWDYDLALDRREWSGRLRQIFGIADDVEPSLDVAQACVHPVDRARFLRTLANARENDLPRFEFAFRIRRANDGAERWVTMSGWRTYKTDSKLRRIIMTARDITDEKTAEERIRWSASHDPLTRLANRSLLHEKLDQAIHSARPTEASSVGLLVLDLDHFKEINDTLGHDAGDMLLKMFAQRLRTVVRPHDTIARFGGDEFAIVMPDIDSERSITALARSVQERLREPFIHEGRLLDCRVSMGASVFPSHGRTSKELLKNADIALYASKAGGRDTVSLFEEHMRNTVQRRSSMVQLARNALRDDRIMPYYQPKISLATGSVAGFEALLRWRTPRGQIGTPASIAAAFDDADVAAQISDRMIDRVIADIRIWLDRGVNFQSVAVNASAAEFRRDNFAERVIERLQRADIPAQCFELEVTETVFLGRGAEYVHRALDLLSRHGIQIALDDFGTGYASLRHLKQFPVNLIKIDRSFVRDLTADAGDDAIVNAVINLGRSLGIKVVAEGVETENQKERLLELKCDLGQGFLFSRAVAARRLPGLLARWQTPAAAVRRPARQLRLVANRC